MKQGESIGVLLAGLVLIGFGFYFVWVSKSMLEIDSKVFSILPLVGGILAVIGLFNLILRRNGKIEGK